MTRKVVWLAVPAALGALVAGGWQDIIRFAKIKQISLGTGHPELVPAVGRRSYPQSRAHRHADGTGDFDSASRGGPALLSGLLSRRGRPWAAGPAPLAHVPGSRNAGALVADGRGRDASNGIARGATTVDSRTALVERATQAEPLSCSRVR